MHPRPPRSIWVASGRVIAAPTEVAWTRMDHPNKINPNNPTQELSCDPSSRAGSTWPTTVIDSLSHRVLREGPPLELF